MCFCVIQAAARPGRVLQCGGDVAVGAGAEQLSAASLCPPLCPLFAGRDSGQEPQS